MGLLALTLLLLLLLLLLLRCQAHGLGGFELVVQAAVIVRELLAPLVAPPVFLLQTQNQTRRQQKQQQ